MQMIMIFSFIYKYYSLKKMQYLADEYLYDNYCPPYEKTQIQRQQIPDVVSGAGTSFSLQDGLSDGKEEYQLKIKVEFGLKVDL